MSPHHRHLTALPLLSLLTTALSQTAQQTTWAAVTYTFHGEKTPAFSHPSPYDLTPLGAQQLYNAGQGVRNRYITSLNISQSTFPVNGLSVNAIENQQLYVLGTDDSFVSASATAFMQGLYPPFDALDFGEESQLGNGSLVQFPLNGYQYPNIGTVSSLDFNYLYIAGHIDCTQYSISQVKSLSTPAYVQKIQATEEYYASLHDTVFPTIDVNTLNYGNAYGIYEAALYAYRHNESIYNSQDFTTDDMAILRNLASEQQWGFNTPNGTDLINSISGQTFASKILQQFSHTIASQGVSDKLTLLFGSYEPFLAFFALSNLATGPSASKFTSLPDHGSTMTFELFSYTDSSSAGKNLSTPMPYKEDLYVRFLFRNGTEPESPFISYALFGRGNSEDVMPWADFVKGMGSFSLDDVVEWCQSCGSITMFCEAIEENTGNGTSGAGIIVGGSEQKGVSPTIGGVIGATVAIAAFIFLAAGLLLAGFRIEHRGNKDSGFGAGDISVLKRSSSGNAGFKGADRLGSDADLAVKSGAGATIIRHERVGSWELGESPNGERDQKHSSLDKEIESGRVRSMADYGRRSEDLAQENPFGDPVKPVERV